MRRIVVPRRQRRIRVPLKSDYWHLHAHSRYSAKDSLADVGEMVEIAKSFGQPALALTDHGNMAGTVQLYKACRKHGLAPFPGQEFYLKADKRDKKAKRYHVGIVAFTTEGYEALVKLSTRSHTRETDNFHHYPHVDFSDFAEWHELGWTEGLALTTGCYFGMVQQTLIEKGEHDAEWLVRSLAHWFPHTYVELQHHHIDHDGFTDDDMVEAMHAIAIRTGLPTVITQDAHYCTQDDKEDHETLKRLISWADDPSEAVFPGDSFHLANERFVRSHYSDELWRDGIYGLTDLLNKHTLTVPELERYHYNVPVVTDKNPLEEMMAACTSVLAEMRGTGYVKPRMEDDYYYRLDEEYEVVEATDMAGYMMLNKMICDYMDKEGIFYEARGSASGSLICYLLGITQVDPIREGLRYERFLSKDRTKPPDIDLDVEDTRRGEVIAMLADQFNVCQIGTWAEYSLDDETGRGSLFVDYLSHKRKEGVDPATLGMIKTVRDIPRADYEELQGLSAHQCFKSYGTHAGGLVITSNYEDFERLVPTMLVASSDTTVTQYEMDDVEELGLLKEDILGQTSLTTMRRAIENLGRDVMDGWDWIPLNDKDVLRSIRNQDVDGVFQLEGWTARKGCREMRPKKLDDLRDLLALYRPATMDSGIKDTYIQRRAGWEVPPRRHEYLEEALRETHGLPVFQDQIIVILRMIGFTPDDLTKLLKAVKASNENIGNAAQVIQSYQQMFYDLSDAAGFGEADQHFVWNAIEGFSKYGFNKAHAATYARRSYRMAYLRTHYPLEFHAALLQTFAGTKKEPDYILATKEAGIKMLGPDVNISGQTWTLDHERQAIRKGLLSIKGIGDKAAQVIAQNAPYTSITDMIERCPARPVTGGKNYHRDGSLNGVLGILDQAKALRSLKRG